MVKSESKSNLNNRQLSVYTNTNVLSRRALHVSTGLNLSQLTATIAVPNPTETHDFQAPDAGNDAATVTEDMDQRVAGLSSDKDTKRKMQRLEKEDSISVQFVIMKGH
ncbi:hypothetical protein QE152_g34881 [Popillia japonica]|uniref:Uncharacterized protein n=1 Tax=Popillia japonica TaxID=7064 RepID=A0AAW1ITE4_POPJA